MEGKVINNRYKIIEKIGSGGMADVWKAEDTLLKRVVALKILHKQFVEDENFLERFRREAQAAAKLTHPNIVSIFDVGEDDGTQYIVMEYAPGTNLKQIIQKDAPLPPEKAVHIASQICNAMAFAHQHEIIHRDIKPHNVIITPEEAIKVTDFGIARAGSSSTMTRTGTIIGTAHYISPEQAQGGMIGSTTDIYSLGVVLYEMLTGELPFRGENPVAVALKHIHETPMPPRSVYSAVPESLEAIIIKAMAKNPADRYQSAMEMQADLKRFQEGLPIKVVATPPPKISKEEEISRTMVGRRAAAPSKPQKKWLIPALIALGVLLLIGGFALTYSLLSPATVVVPDLKGKTLSQAQRAVEAKGLELEVAKEVYNEKIPPGRVISQDPAAGEKIKKGGTIQVTLSKGLATLKVPSLVGKTQEEAENILKKAGLEVGKVERAYSDTVPEGSVISQSPKAGAKVEKGSSVDIVVSDGKEEVRVPDVVGRTSAEATSILEGAGFKVSRFDDWSDTVPEDHVIRQTPSAGEKAKKGSTVTIAVSKGKKTVQLDDLRGKTQAEATSWLNSNGLTANVITSPDPFFPHASGTVWDQDPAPGTTVDKGSTVTIKVQP